MFSFLGKGAGVRATSVEVSGHVLGRRFVICLLKHVWL